MVSERHAQTWIATFVVVGQKSAALACFAGFGADTLHPDTGFGLAELMVRRLHGLA
jgi:hypothetical protein